MYNLLHDAAKGAGILVGVLEGEPVSLADLPPDIQNKVHKFATNLGMEADKLTEGHQAFLFDLLDKAIQAMSNEPEGHAQAGAVPEAPDNGNAVESVPGATPPVETAPVSEEAAKAASTEATLAGSGEAPAADAGAATHPGEPVTTADAGHVICPTCNGFRTEVQPTGGTIICTTCKGAGQVPAAPPAGATA